MWFSFPARAPDVGPNKPRPEGWLDLLTQQAFLAVRVHARHVGHWLTFADLLHDLVVLFGRQDADKGHHALHETTPSRP